MVAGTAVIARSLRSPGTTIRPRDPSSRLEPPERDLPGPTGFCRGPATPNSVESRVSR